MAFNTKPTFGTTNTSGFGQTTFGSFGQTSAAFGSGGTTTFGTSQPQQPSLFGGQPQTSVFGGQPQASTFGTQPQTATFGAPQQSTGFGAPQQTVTSTFGTSGGSLFGATTPGTTFGAQTGTSLFGNKPATTGAFGTTNTGFGGFGTNTSTAGQSGFGGFGNFNQPATSTQPSLFAGFGQTQTTNAMNTLNFGSTNKPLGTTSGLGGFGGFSGFGQPQQPQQQQQQPPLSASDLLYSSIYQVNLYGDERDTIIAKFNMLMAFAGIGKGYFNANQSVDYSSNNDLYKFTSVVYNSKPNATQKDSFVYLNINKKYEDVQKEESNLISRLSTIFGDKPNMSITVNSVSCVDGDKCRLIFYMNEKQANGLNKRIASTEIVNFLLQPMPKQQLTQLGVFDVNVYQSLDEDTLNQYLEQPPPGINAILWKNAQRDNPDPDKFIPVPIIGFEGIKQRMKLQEEETKLQQAFLNNIANQICELQNEHLKSGSKIVQFNQTILNLHNRLLKVIVKQEITRNIGLSLNSNEELIKSNFENLYSMINNNEYNFKNKISDMLCSIKLRANNLNFDSHEKYIIDSNDLNDIKMVFIMQQKAITSLLSTSNNLMSTIGIIKQGLDLIMNREQ